MVTKFEERTTNLNKVFLDVYAKTGKRKLRDTDFFGTGCVGITKYSVAFFKVIANTIDLPRKVTGIRWGEKKVKLDSGGETTEMVVELAVKNSPNFVFHGLNAGYGGEGPNALHQIMLHCGFSPVDADDAFKYVQAEYQRNPESYYTKEDINDNVFELVHILVINGIDEKQARNFIVAQTNMHKVSQLKLQEIVKNKNPKDILKKREFRNALNKFKRWGY